MNCHTPSFRAATAALAIGLAGCASEPPPRYTSYTPRHTPPPPQSYGTVSVRYVQPATQATPAPAPASANKQLPHWRRALTYLQTARENLEASSPTRSGQREAAIQHTNQAISHVEAGIAHANSR